MMSASILEADEVELQSPVSLTGSLSIRSNQVASFDIEDASHTSWRIGMPWFQSPSSRYNNDSPSRISNLGGAGPIPAGAIVGNNTSIASASVEENRYYGGVMKPANRNGGAGMRVANGPTAPPPLTNMMTIQQNKESSSPSFPLRRTQSKDSIGDFADSEWTPPDSSYGAACPVCGCIPKHVRRMVEFTMIAVMVVGFVYLLITTSINLSDDRNKSQRHNNSTSSATSLSSLTDDDNYLEYAYKGSTASSSSETTSGDDNVAPVDDDIYVDDFNYKNNKNNNNNQNGGGYNNNNYRYRYSYNINNNNDRYLNNHGYDAYYNYNYDNNDMQDDTYQATDDEGRERIRRQLRSWI